ncbi:2OG-Fe(II) oxygenase [Mesorhizobium sp. M0767]|uniref:prolyl hydroxylase family protein n=1 Tax=Mesorhizobium sp. M0767 TaxID=2956995 RepID=UPI00333C1809
MMVHTSKLSITWLATHIRTIDGFLDDQECADLIADSERRGFEAAKVNSSGGATVLKELRNNDRVVFDDEDLADLLFARARPLLYRGLGDWRLTGLNERFRFYRYGPGQKFDCHHDGYFERHALERSQFTFMIYLSDGFEGGGTSFRGEVPGYAGSSLLVKPKKGMALAFYHPIEHRGDEVLSGRKYVIRTDVMYKRQ